MAVDSVDRARAERGWNRPRGAPSLSEVFGSIAARPSGSFWRKLVTFLGPGYLVAVGYMDPGNWATSLAGGSKFGYALLSIALLSNVMAIVLQSLCTRLGVGAGRDLAQACRDSFPRWVSLPLWVSAEVAITATVMTHNLYLHSGLVQTRDYGDSIKEKREAITLATIDSSIALCLALTINASILILAAATFHRIGKTDVAELDQAHGFLAPLLGSTLAPTLFAIALLCCGLNSTITATLSGQIVMEGFLNLRIAPWLRRMVTRMIAIVPAVVVTIWAGEKATGQLLILSQVVLSLQLPFAVVPLVVFTASRAKMGPFTAPRWLTVLAALTGAVIIALNAKLVWDYASG